MAAERRWTGAWRHAGKQFPALFSTLLLGILAVRAAAQPPGTELQALTRAYFPQAMESFDAFLRLANDGHYPEEIAANLAWTEDRFRDLGFATRVLDSKGVPHLFAERRVVKARGTVLVYLQIDGQPVDASAWDQADPFEPTLKRPTESGWQTLPPDTWRTDFHPDDRIFARSASDSKGPAISFLSALAILAEQGREPDFDLKVIADFQEEMGSPTLPALVEAERELFAADVMLIMDGTRHLSNLPTLTFGARGITTVTLTVFGATRDLHSGQYGNFAPNPVFTLSHLLASMKDETGRVSVPGFYEGVSISESDRRALQTIPEDAEAIRRSLGIARTDAVGSTYQEALQYPSLNVRGLRAAWVGDEVRTLIPRQAIAEIDMRLVPETPGERQVDLLTRHIRAEGFHIIAGEEPTATERAQYPRLIRVQHRIGSRPFRTDMDSPLGAWLGDAMQRVFGDRFVKMRTTGGSQPIAPFITTLGVPAVSVRIPNPDNSIHAPNENLRLGNLIEGIETCLAILTEPWP